MGEGVSMGLTYFLRGEGREKEDKLVSHKRGRREINAHATHLGLDFTPKFATGFLFASKQGKIYLTMYTHSHIHVCV